MFTSINNSQFQLKFTNGYCLSVGFGPSHYCDRQSFEASVNPRDERHWESRLAEIAIVTPEGSLLKLDGDTVEGYVNTDAVAKIAMFVSQDDIESAVNVIKFKGAY